MIILPLKILEAIKQHSIAELPNEACGILAGRDQCVEDIYPMKNTDASPVSFFMDPEEQLKIMKELRENGLEMTAIYHSHPDGKPCPSERDRELAFYEDTLHVIASCGSKGSFSVKAFRIKQGESEEEKLVVEK